jgi:hypothetical protein
MGCLYYPRKQTSVSHAADRDVIACYGRATLFDKHLASKIQCVDDEIIEWLERREKRRRDRHVLGAKSGTPVREAGKRLRTTQFSISRNQVNRLRLHSQDQRYQPPRFAQIVRAHLLGRALFA